MHLTVPHGPSRSDIRPTASGHQGIILGWCALALVTRERTSFQAPTGRLLRLGALLALFLVGSLSNGLLAQQTPSAASSASIAGTVLDSRGSAIPGAQVKLIGQDNSVAGEMSTDAAGGFTFSAVARGIYRVTVESADLEPSVSGEIVLSAGERRELPPQTLRIPTKLTTVEVVATENQIAEAQIKQQEQQRIGGLLPNYYTSYVWNAAPLTTKLKFDLGFRTVTDPAVFAVAGIVAGVEQAHKTFPGYGQELGGYAKRYGGTYADTVSARMLAGAVFPTLLHQDPRYFYRGSGSVRSRLVYAILQTLVCRGDNGRIEPNYSHVLGSFTAAGISNLYRTPQDRQLGLTLRNGMIITLSGAAANVMREFLSRKMTPNVPSFANGKP